MEHKYFDINENGLSVRCKLYSHERARGFGRIALATYGFGGNKENHAIMKFAEKLTSKYKDHAVVAFDWPAHGNDGRKRLSAPESMEYTTLAVDYAKRALGAERLCLYSTSYGGYVALRYLVEIGDPFDKICLRCPGIDMYHVFRRNFDEDELHRIERGKGVMKGFERKSEIDREFFDDLREHDIRAYEYFDFADDILLVHGTADEQVPIEDSRAFADANVIELVEVEGANHTFSNPRHMDLAIDRAVKFFAPEA